MSGMRTEAGTIANAIMEAAQIKAESEIFIKVMENFPSNKNRTFMAIKLIEEFRAIQNGTLDTTNLNNDSGFSAIGEGPIKFNQ